MLLFGFEANGNFLAKLFHAQPSDKIRDRLDSHCKQVQANYPDITITENLERLEWFGTVISRTQGNLTRWQYAELQQTA